MSKRSFTETVSMSPEVKSMYMVSVMVMHNLSNPTVKTHFSLGTSSRAMFAKEN